MTTGSVLLVLRNLIAQVDQQTSTVEDTELLAVINVARDMLELRKVGSMESLTVSNAPGANYGIKPDPTTAQGHMLATQAAIVILDSTYRGKLFTGSLGVSWQSGLESESTISAEKAYKSVLDSLRTDLETLILVQTAATAGVRVQ